VRPVAGQARFTVGMAFLTWFVSTVVAYVVTLAVLSATGNADLSVDELPPWAAVVSVTALWVPVLVALRVLSVKWGTHDFRSDYGLRFRWVDVLGIPIGVLTQLVVLELLYWPLRVLFSEQFDRDTVEEPARDLFDRFEGGWLVVLVVIVVIGAPIVEELLYRGLILRSLDGRINDALAVVASAGWFALAHFQGVQLPGLFVLGIILGVLAQRTGRIGMGIFTHAAFNATTVVMLARR
jgi:uncharacterized protein